MSIGLGSIVGSAVGNAVNLSGVVHHPTGEAGGPEPTQHAHPASQPSGLAGLLLSALPPHIAALAASTGQTPPVEGQGSGGSTGSGSGGVSAHEKLRDPVVRAIAHQMGVPGWDFLPLAELIQGMKG